MIHLFKKVYLRDNTDTSSGDFIYIAADADDSRKFPQEHNSRCVGYAASVPEYLDRYGHDAFANFWDSLLVRDTKLTICTDHANFAIIYATYLASMFKDMTPAVAYECYKSAVTNEFLNKDYVLKADAAEVTGHGKRVARAENFYALFEPFQGCGYLAGIQPEHLGIEILLANHLLDEENEAIAVELSKRVETFATENWFSWMNELKREVLAYARDIDNLDPNITVDGGNLEEAISRSAIFGWMVDPEFKKDNFEYVKAKYSRDVFKAATSAYYATIGIDEDHGIETDMVFDEEWDRILHADIGRGFGTTLCGQAFVAKVNRDLMISIYRAARAKRTSFLSRFKV